MNCAWYEQQLLTNAEMWRDGQPTSVLMEHARACADCEATIARELALKLHFAALADSARNAEPSPAIKSALLRELDQLHPQSAAWLPRLAFALVVLVAVAAGLLFIRRTHTPLLPPQRVAAGPVQATPVEPSPVPAPKVVVATKGPVRKPRAVSHRATEQASNADFMPIVMCDSLTCAGPAMTVRVEIPASPLATRDPNRKITADLLVGEDGLVRAVRVLQ